MEMERREEQYLLQYLKRMHYDLWNTRNDVFISQGSDTKRIKLNSFNRNKQYDTREY